VDPHAADVVFRSGIPLVVMPLDVTHQVLTTRKRVDAIGALGTQVARAVVELLEFLSGLTSRNTAATAVLCTTPA